MKKNKGITLVALVTTIVILLILAGASINLVLGEKGLITNAKLATKKVQEDEKSEEKDIENTSDEIMKQLTGSKFINGAPIPDGFYYVGGIRDKGVVISDSIDDKGKYANQVDVGNDLVGNQYVWVPVKNASKFYKVDNNGIELLGGTGVKTYKYSVSSYETMNLPGKVGYREPDTVYYYDNDEKAKETGFENFEEMANLVSNEYSEMIESMEKYRGFYIGRYELSENGEAKGNPITSVTWYQLYKNCKELNNTENVKSRMIGGIQWDAVCEWLENCGYNVQDSESWGNYEDDDEEKRVLQETGLNEKYKANNIYDFAGNCGEWTQEASNVIHRTARDSKNRDSVKAKQSVINRNPHVAPVTTYQSVGTRAMLILK